MNSLVKAVRFPPAAFFITLVVGFTAVQGYIQYAGAGHTPEVRHIETTITTEGNKYQPGSWMQIVVKVGEAHHHKEGQGEDQHAGEVGDHHEGEEEAGEAGGHHKDVSEEVEDHGEEQFEKVLVHITIYAPDGSIFADREEMTGQDGEAVFNIFIEPGSRTGTYTIVPEATVEGQPAVIGETMAIEVAG